MLALNASASSSSRTHAVAVAAVELAGEGDVVNLSELDAEGLLGRRPDPVVTELMDLLGRKPRLVLVTPVYRATYSGLLKVLFDQLPQEALVGTACVLAATAAQPEHFLSIDTGFRALVASLGGWTVPTVTYALSHDFDDRGRPAPRVLETLQSALGEAVVVTGGLG
jgi:FMN reductase